MNITQPPALVCGPRSVLATSFLPSHVPSPSFLLPHSRCRLLFPTLMLPIPRCQGMSLAEALQLIGYRLTSSAAEAEHLVEHAASLAAAEVAVAPHITDAPTSCPLRITSADHALPHITRTDMKHAPHSGHEACITSLHHLVWTSLHTASHTMCSLRFRLTLQYSAFTTLALNSLPFMLSPGRLLRKKRSIANRYTLLTSASRNARPT
jgi:hypothetical protein